MANSDTTLGSNQHPDPITGEPNSRPLGTGIGAASGAATGAAMGAIGGPVGAVIGGAIGAVTGGLVGKGIEESVDPDAHDAYWRSNHGSQSYANTGDYTQYQSAYRTGYMGAGTHVGHTFDEAEAHLKNDYESTKDAASVSWDHAKHATRNAFEHAGQELKQTGRDIKRAVD